MSLIHSMSSFMEYLSKKEWLISSQKSLTIVKPWPSFFGMQNEGEFYKELALLTTPNLSHLSNDCSINIRCVSGILNCFLYTRLVSFGCILWVKLSARPRSYLFVLIVASWCLKRWAFCSLSSLETFVFGTFGNLSLHSLSIEENIESWIGIRLFCAKSRMPSM